MAVFPALLSHRALLPNLKVAQSSLGKWVPTVGWTTFLAGNVVDVTRASIERELDRSNDIALFPGGAREMIECEPESASIRLVKHSGFLRLARARGTRVVPTFWFGMNDSHVSWIPTWDAWMYKRTGASIPFWVPAADRGIVGVFGHDIDTSEFASDADLARYYFEAVEDLFNHYKKEVGGEHYAGRKIVWVEPHSKQPQQERGAKPRGTTGHNITTGVSLIFWLAVACGWVFAGGTWWSFSTWEAYASGGAQLPFLHVHLTACLVWASLSGVLTVVPFRSIPRLHRKLGTLAATAIVPMTWSGISLSATSVAEHPWSINKAFHAFCNFQISFLTIYLATYGISSVARWNKRTEHVLLGVSLVPRFSATFFRWLGLAYWSNDTSFSLACLAQLLWQLGQIVSSRRNATRTKTKTVAAGKKTWNVKKLIMHSNKLSAALSLLSLAVTSTGFFSSNTGRAAGVSLLATVALAYADCRRDFAYDSIIQEARKELDQLKTLSQAPAPESASRTTVPAHKAYHGELQHWYFDVFRKNDLQLQTLVMDVFDDMNLLSKYKISTDKLRRFTEEVAGSYCIDAPYHNKYHAYDVLHVSYLLVTTCGAGEYLAELDTLSLFAAAFAHDAGHDGYNNAHHEATMSSLAVTYNSISAQENHSAALLFRTTNKDECDIFQHMQKEERATVRARIVKLILNTDAMKHFELMGRFDDALETKTLTKGLLSSMLLHIADVSNPVRPFSVSRRWAEAVQEEFFRQGDKEKALGLECTTYMDRDAADLPGMQLAFIDAFVGPAFRSVADFLPSIHDYCLERLASNRAEWKKRGEEEERVGGGGKGGEQGRNSRIS
ncbi:hypothetical protein TeGR_g3547, partial [Tetraparma gracilis]